MEKIQKVDSCLKWIALILALMCILVCFAPAYGRESSSFDNKDVEYYFYDHNFPAVNLFTIVILILAVTLLFSTLKNGKIFFIGLSFTYFLYNIFTLVTLSNTIEASTSTSYKYKFLSGYYLLIIFMALYMAVVIAYFVMAIIQRFLENQKGNKNDNVKSLQNKIETISYLKEQGILSEEEYQEKRAKIVENLKI
ncbi:MAG: hypothetical protein K2N57_03000 [Clostridia bacterium]|nr:hypothetical protein [Clostridia bacterium]